MQVFAAQERADIRKTREQEEARRAQETRRKRLDTQFRRLPQATRDLLDRVRQLSRPTAQPGTEFLKEFRNDRETITLASTLSQFAHNHGSSAPLDLPWTALTPLP